MQNALRNPIVAGLIGATVAMIAKMLDDKFIQRKKSGTWKQYAKCGIFVGLLVAVIVYAIVYTPNIVGGGGGSASNNSHPVPNNINPHPNSNPLSQPQFPQPMPIPTATTTVSPQQQLLREPF